MSEIENCPDCGQEGDPDIEYIRYACGTIYRIEQHGDGPGLYLYGPHKGRTKDCYEMEIQNLKSRIRFLTQDKAALLQHEAALRQQLEEAVGLLNRVIDPPQQLPDPFYDTLLAITDFLTRLESGKVKT